MDRRSSLIEPEHSSTLPDGGPRRCDAEARAAATWPPSPDPGAPAARLKGRHLGGHGVPPQRRRGSVGLWRADPSVCLPPGPLPTMLRPSPQAPGVSQGAPASLPGEAGRVRLGVPGQLRRFPAGGAGCARRGRRGARRGGRAAGCGLRLSQRPGPVAERGLWAERPPAWHFKRAAAGRRSNGNAGAASPPAGAWAAAEGAGTPRRRADPSGSRICPP